MNLIIYNSPRKLKTAIVKSVRNIFTEVAIKLTHG
jgi:hypothetical protein